MRVLVIVSLLGACGGGGDGGGTADASGDAAPAGKRVFVTSADFGGGFGMNDFTADAAALADQQCQSAAQGGGLAGTWHAWLSQFGDGTLPSRTATERVTGDGPWYLVGTSDLVFLNRSALANTPRVAINRNELGAVVASGPVWTGTAVGGTLGSEDCMFWRSSNSAQTGTFGRLESTGSTWTDNGTTQNCGVRAHLYCFQM